MSGRAYRIPSRLMMATRQARQRRPDGTFGPAYFTFEDAATILQVPLMTAIEMTQDGTLQVVYIDGEAHIGAESLVRFPDEGSLTPGEHANKHLRWLRTVALMHPAGIEVGYRTEIFPEGITDAAWAPLWDAERERPRALVIEMVDRTLGDAEVARRLVKRMSVGFVPGPDGGPATEEDVDRDWVETVGELGLDLPPPRQLVMPPEEEITPELMRRYRPWLREFWVGQVDEDGQVITGEIFDARFDADWGADE